MLLPVILSVSILWWGTTCDGVTDTVPTRVVLLENKKIVVEHNIGKNALGNDTWVTIDRAEPEEYQDALLQTVLELKKRNDELELKLREDHGL